MLLRLRKTILDVGLVREEVGRYVLTGPLPPLTIPATLQDDALMVRLAIGRTGVDAIQVAVDNALASGMTSRTVCTSHKGNITLLPL